MRQVGDAFDFVSEVFGSLASGVGLQRGQPHAPALQLPPPFDHRLEGFAQDQIPQGRRIKSASFASMMDPGTLPFHAHPLWVHGVAGHGAQHIERPLGPHPLFSKVSATLRN